MKFASLAAPVAASLVAAAGVICMPASAADMAPAAAPTAAPGAAPASSAPAMPAGSPLTAEGEPAVAHTVIEDGRTRIDELRVRGQLQRVTVQPKGAAPSYEIITGDGSRALTEGADSSRGAAGKRVWNVFRF
ncbi:MAG: DUF2782 domain-containing protein [Caldimonas sp.]